jgi:hypothetical protein
MDVNGQDHRVLCRLNSIAAFSLKPEDTDSYTTSVASRLGEKFERFVAMKLTGPLRIVLQTCCNSKLSQKTHHMFITKPNRLMLFRKTITVCNDNGMGQVNALYE